MRFLRIREVVPLEGFRLRLRLIDDTLIERDISELLRGPIFEERRQHSEKFRDVRVQGGTVVWGNGADLCPDVLIWGGPPPEKSEATTVVATLRVQPPELP